MCKKLLYLMVLVLVLLRATEQASAWTKTIGFEDGTVGQKAQGTADSFGSAGTDSLFSNAYSSEGSQSCHFHFRECEGIWGKAHAYFSYPANIPYGAEVWVRCYIYQKSPWSNGYCGPFTSGMWKFFRIARHKSDATWRGYASIIGQPNGQLFMSNEGCPNPSVYQNVGTPVVLGSDVWNCVEMYFKFHETDGINRMWINGELKVEKTNFKTADSGDYADFSYIYTTWNDKPEHDMDSYMDSIVITTNTPGQEDSYGNPMIGLIDNPKATNPSPVNGATDVSITADLSWNAGTDSTSSNVYFGTDSTPDSGELQGNQTATTFDPGTLSNSTTYYWRIDELKPGTTTTGSVWSFTTVSASLPGAASSPSPANSATDVSTTADLSWTAGSGATSHDVYFGITSPGTFQGNQAATTFDTGTMANNTTYYWRIDEVNAAGTTTGTVWSFAVIAGALPGQASSPSPVDSAGDVSVNADLSWTAGNDATSHDVYFGTDSTPDAGELQGNQTATTFDTATMNNDTTYYWRIDPINASGTTTGDVWSFTTIVDAPEQATSPSPSNSATDVSITADLSWTAGSGATSHDVYFGTDSTPDSSEFQGNQTATTFDTGTMSNNTTYYWRIDQVNAGGTATGIVWSFTTIVAAPSAATNPGPADSATDVTTNTDLSWSAGSGATSHDVYFGTSSPGTFQGNQTATTFDTGAMDNDTTYYWRINEINAAGTTTGSIWSFTTEAGGSTTEEFGDATNTDYSGTVADTWTNVGTSTTNYSSNTALNTYTWPADTSANTTIIKWDLTDISTGATVTEATLYLYQTDSGGDSSYQISVHKIVNVDPGIGTLTWATYDGTNSWTGGSNGGQGDIATAEDSPSVNNTDNQYKTWDVTDMVADWVATPANNYGMLLNSDDVASVDSYRYFASSDAATASTRPKLIVTYSISPPGQASSPSPSNSATGVGITADLSWTAGSGSTSSDVYFGTTSPGASQGNQTATTFDTGTMTNDTTYYWRIDAVNAAGTTTGTVWSFTTIIAAPSQASNPGPSNSATGVSITADLSWTAGAGATSHDVYFGTSSPGTFQGNQTATTYDAGTLDSDTTYYWRIDEVNAAGTTTGTVWSFTTVSGGQVVKEFGDATNTDYAGTVTDTWTNVGTSSTNYSSNTALNTHTWPADTSANTTIIKWDLTDISTTATVVDATLYLYQINSAGDSLYDVDVHKIINIDPNISACTWATYDGANSWTGGSDGGQSDIAAAEDSPSLNLTNNQYKTWDVTDMVQDWVTTPSGNYGMLLNSDDVASSDSCRYFASSDAATASTRPKLIVTYSVGVELPEQAGSASPSDSTTDVSITADLSWAVGSGATSHDVYFGTDSTPDSGELQGNQTATTFDPGTMANNTTYYWRIDEVNAAGTTTGAVWSFTTIIAAPSQASNPTPANSATDVSITADLSWTAGSGSTSSNVYFGTTSPGTLQGNQTATTFDTGTMSNNTTYYWRIDEVNAGGTTTGTVWSFTTISAEVEEEFGDATNTDYPGTVTDTWTNVGTSTTNYSSNTALNTYTWPADTSANTTIIEWDLTDISTGATVTEATLYLYQTDSGGDSSYQISVHKITGVDPNIGALTWATYDGTNSWTGGSNGGQGDIATAEDTPSVNDTDNQYKTWDVTDMVADWVATPANNYGMLLNSDDDASSDSYRYFASSDAASASTRPKLIVTYSD
ncbi:MAG: beta strand repeat-containing protein [Planctomycetota bacterium]|jgi:hypothetical protein